MTTLLFAGDTFCRARDGGDPFRDAGDLLGGADLRMINLETALCDLPPTAKKHVRLVAPAINASFLIQAGIDCVHVDNNHTRDCGTEGVVSMRRQLSAYGIRRVEPGHTWVDTDRGIAICGRRLYADDPAGQRDLLETVGLARTLAGTVVVSLHWGEEHMPWPSPEQIEIAHTLVNAGANVVVGHHPHCVQGIERYHGAVIAYSLGNFSFWQFDRPTAWYNRLGIVLRVDIHGDKTLTYEPRPCWIGEDWRPGALPGRHTQWHSYIDHLSAGIGQYSEAEWYEWLGWEYVHQTVRSSLIATSRYGLDPLRRLLRWLTFPHTWKAIRGTLRAGGIDRWADLPRMD